MAKMIKKLRNKVSPKPTTNTSSGKPKQLSYFLIFVIVFTIFVMIVSWDRFDAMNRGLYVLLLISLSITLIGRHAKLTDSARSILEKVGYAVIGLAAALFFMICYEQIFG